MLERTPLLQIFRIFQLDNLHLRSQDEYFVVDVGEEGTYGEAEGVLGLVGKA